MAADQKIKFRSAYSGHENYFSPTGDGYNDEYEYKLNAKGQKTLVKNGRRDVLSEIQQYKEDVSIENILAKVAVGDYTDFRPDGIYQDTTQIPNNLNEARAVMLDLENYWNTLPAEVREKFDNSLETFITQAGSEAWGINLGLPKETIKEEAPEETPETPAPEKNE